MFCKINKTWRVFAVVLLALATSAICNLYSTADTFAAYSVSLATSGDIELDISIDGGKGSGIVLDEVTATSTCPLGYTVSIMGPADTTLYKDGDKATNENTTNKILPTSGTKTNPLPLVGSDNGNNGSYLGTWGYTLDASATTSSNAFIGLTNTITELYTKTSASGNGQTGQGATTTDTISIYYGASADITRASGLYKLAESSTGANDNVITYIITANPACNTLAVKYNDNGANSPTTMSNQIIDLSSTTDLTLWPSNFKRSGYGFAGWNTKADGTGTSYGPNQTIPEADLQTFIDNNVTIDNGAQYINLYAMWIPSQGTIQNWQGCNTMNIGDITALTDTRDNDTYAIAKLADGKCWMIENLRLGGTDGQGNAVVLNNTNTNNPSSGFAFAASQDPTVEPWCNVMSSDCIDYPRIYTGNTTNSVANMSSENANIYSYGNYYNWYSVTAGTGGYGASAGNAPGSVCPTGWHLPTGGAGGEFSSLDIAIGGTGDSQYTSEASNRWRAHPQNFVPTSYVINGWIPNRGSGGTYWAATASDSTRAYSTTFAKTDLGPGTFTNYMQNGFAARCVADRVANLDTGANINLKLKSLASGTNVTNIGTSDNLIKSFVRSNTLPTNFAPTTANTISLTDSPSPVYVWFDSSIGVMSYYSEANVIYANSSFSSVFRSMGSLADISGLTDWKVDNVTDMNTMFSFTQISDLTPIANWKVDNVTKMNFMFLSTQISDLTPIANWKVDNVTDMSSMFFGTQISDLTPIANWKVDNVTDMNTMFVNTQISDLTPITNWKVDNVTDMSSMFASTQISNLAPIANWKVDNVTDMFSMFFDTQISDLTPITNWKVDNVTNMNTMFYSTQISDLTPIANWKVDNVTTMDSMFLNTQISNLTPITNWKVDNVTDMSYMFASTQISNLAPIANWKVDNVTDMSGMFASTKISNLDSLEGWNVSKVTNMWRMFYDIPTLTFSDEIDSWNVGSVGPNTTTGGFTQMFGGSTPKTNLPIFTVRPGTWDANGTYTPNT